MALPAAFTAFRTCYRHPAGATGVALSRWLVQAGHAVLTPPPVGTPDARGGIPALGAYILTPSGHAALTSLGVAGASVRAGGSHKACADYTVRRPDGRRGVPHVGGTLGAALTAWLLRNGYAERLPHPTNVYNGRTLLLTAPGADALAALGIQFAVRV